MAAPKRSIYCGMPKKSSQKILKQVVQMGKILRRNPRKAIKKGATQIQNVTSKLCLASFAIPTYQHCPNAELQAQPSYGKLHIINLKQAFFINICTFGPAVQREIV